ncbi:MAG: transglutaminase domain-containing protein [Candidatus Wallbacteria bacterium]|nr:transglutaminase domain-containing protein [Candidatus Wallbacteria bacterium]
MTARLSGDRFGKPRTPSAPVAAAGFGGSELGRFLVRVVALALLLSRAALAGEDPFAGAARYELVYRVELPAASASEVAVWVPYPSEDDFQKVLEMRVETGLRWRFTAERRFGNRLLYFRGGRGPSQILLTYRVARRPSGGSRSSGRGTPRDPELYRAADALVPIDGSIALLARRRVRGCSTDARKARALYNHVVSTLRYDKQGEGWGRGDALWACTSQRGNCTDFHSLFIAMARSVGLPARFVIGFPIPQGAGDGAISGYHCWAEYFDRASGWVPVDISEARKSGRVDAYFGHLPEDRVQFTVGRDLVLEPPQKGAPLNFFIYPYAEADGKPLDGVRSRFSFRRVDARKG